LTVALSDALEETLRRERAQDGSFESLPFHYVEIGSLLLRT
jgi:hypothetical protein